MMRKCWRVSFAILAAAAAVVPSGLRGQVARAVAAQERPEPTTKLEAFQPAAGSVVTFGYDELGSLSGISVDARELRTTGAGQAVRGLVVDVRESEYKRERAFIDADEIPELLKGIDALLEVSANPTSFKNFEVRYTTRGELQLTAFNNNRGAIQFVVRAGRITSASSFIDRSQMGRLREMFQAGMTRLESLAGSGD